jgi:hypothetical protein
MCPFCIGTALWIAVGVVSTGGVTTLAVAKVRNSKTHDHGGSHVEQQTLQQ